MTARDAPLRLLLVEDEAADAELTRDLFEEAGVATEWRHARRLSDVDCAAIDEWADCALVDLGLPDSRGVDTVERLLDGAPSVPIVVLSGNVDISVALSCVAHGAKDYVVKGRSDADLLTRTVRYAIGRNSLELELRRAQQRVAVAEDRFRIAEDLHNSVLQRLFVTGLGLQTALADPTASDALRTRIGDAVDLLDLTTEELRAEISPWRSPME